MKAALAGVLIAWLCLLQGAYGVANLAPEVTDPANFLPPRILIRADVTTSIKPSRPQTFDRQGTASALPLWLSREPLGESESLNLYSYCHNDPINNVDRLGLESVPMYQNQMAEAMAKLGWAPGEHGRKSTAIDGQWAQWMEMFAGLEALAQKGDPRALHQLRLLRNVHQGSHEMNDQWLEFTMMGAQATIDVASAGIDRIYRQSSFMEWVSGRDAGSLDPAGDPAYFDDDNPEFQGDEWSRRFIQFSPGGKIARESVNGNYGAASFEFGKEVAIWSTFGIAGEFVGTGRVAFGVTRGGMGGAPADALVGWHNATNARYTWGKPPGGHWTQGVSHQLRTQWGLVGTEKELHHWLIPQGRWGKYVPNYIKNRPWNLKIASSRAAHARIDTAFTSRGVTPYPLLVRPWMAMPNWARATTIGGGFGAGYGIAEGLDDE